MAATRWKCPKCGASAGECGKQVRGAICNGPEYAGRDHPCVGLICECDGDGSLNHGETEANPCEEANCYHCGWGGRLPVRSFDPKKLKGWAKEAYKAGWTPPDGWRP